MKQSSLSEKHFWLGLTSRNKKGKIISWCNHKFTSSAIYHSVVNKLQFTYYKCSIAIQFLKRIANPKFFDKYI